MGSRRFVLLPNDGEGRERNEEWLRWHTTRLGWDVVDEGGERGDVPIFWRKSEALGRRAAYRRKGLILDPLTIPATGDVLGAWMLEQLPDETGASRKRLAGLIAEQHGQRALVFGSGPHPVLPEPRPGDVHIYLASSVFDAELCERFPPHFVVAADGASQFEMNGISERFRRRVEALVQAGAVLVAPALYRPVVEAHWDATVADTAIWVRRTRSVEPGHRLSKAFAYAPTSNVLTALGLPLAASLADEIVLTGITVSDDGPSVTGHWSHAEEAAYQRDVTDIVGHTPGSVARGDYRDAHFARLASDLWSLSEAGVTFATPEGPLEIVPASPPPAPPNAWVFAFLDWLDHRPEAVWSVAIVAALAAIVLSGRLLMGTMTLMLGAMAVALLAGLLALALYLRVRMARMVAETEARLAAQQAQQFRNLSTRLEAIEKTLSGSTDISS